MPEKSASSSGVFNDSSLSQAREFCELIPGAASLWSRNRSFRVLNEFAMRLMNYTDAEFLRRPSFWVDRIHPADRATFSQFIGQLEDTKSTAQCDYRIFPRGASRPLWIRDISLVSKIRGATPWELVSIYTDISDLKLDRDTPADDANGEIVRTLLHEVQNRIQKTTMELELAQMESKCQLNVADITSSIKRSLQDLGDQLASMRERRALQNLAKLLSDVLEKRRKKFDRQNVKLLFVPRQPLPSVEGNKDQLCDAFDQVVECCGSMLTHGGILEVQAQQKKLGGQIFAEVKMTSSPVKSPAETGNFEEHPEGHRVKVKLALASEILRRHRGELLFEKESDTRCRISVLIKAPPQ